MWLKTNLLKASVTFPLDQPPAPGQWTALPVSLPVTKHGDVTSKEMGTLRLWGQVHSSVSLKSLWTHPLGYAGMEPRAETYRKGHIIPRKESCEWASKQRWKQHLLETVLFSNPLKTLLTLLVFCETNTRVKNQQQLWFSATVILCKPQARQGAMEPFFSWKLGSARFLPFPHRCSVIQQH